MHGGEPLDFARGETGFNSLAKSMRHEVYKYIDKQLEAGDLSAELKCSRDE
jgi:hypothetical protein